MSREGQARVLTTKERDIFLKVIAAGERTAERDVAMAYLSYGNGLRVGEIASLTIGDIIDASGKMRDQFDLKRKNTKNKKSRSVYLTSAKVREALQAYIDHLMKGREGGIWENYKPDTILFKSVKGLQMTGNSLQQVFARLYKSAGFEGCKSHSGRRTFATKLIDNGADLPAVRELMGHASITMTAKYVESSPDRLKMQSAKALQ